ncbi:hypothetical protein LSH36_592g00048 [Paralvinella palmiformis]|uniref:Cyclic nucleotide-binding domain-containing protein n=1 Tax=Paralvinella palmiformis TaxID=53620 RepID=A0AAD9J5S3_9ANNE|nr:hypothetical protein LSH36_592g00048 [Paralvinella palmiformis]
MAVLGVSRYQIGRIYNRKKLDAFYASRDVTGRSLQSMKTSVPLLRFRRAVRTILTLLKATTSNSRGQQLGESKVLSFAQYRDEILNNKRSNYGGDLTFDPLMYRAHKETQISNEAKTILSLDPSDRTEDQFHIALLALNAAVDAFSEFPITMQRSLVRVGWYEHFEAKRIIIRQGHMADNFYFILSGKALVTILETDKKTGESRANTVATLRKGNSFGELALMHGAKRSATVTCKDDVELLAVGREDFIDIFMHVEKNTEPEHIQFLRQIDILRGWPIDKLPWDDPKICLFTYFRRGVVMCRDSNRADWIYIIKTGSCKVLKKLLATKPNVPGLEQLRYSDVTDNKNTSWHPPHVHRGQHLRSAFSSLNGSVSNLSSTGSSGEAQSSRREKLDVYYGRLPPIRAKTNSSILGKGCEDTDPYMGDVTWKGDGPYYETHSVEGSAAVEALMEQHKHTLDQIYRMKHEDYMPKKVRMKLSDQEARNKQQTVFVQVQKLGSKDTFGLEHVAFSLMDKCTSVSLVSDGSEAILISKKFFLQHLSDDVRKRLRTSIQPYPTEESLQQKLQDMSNWEAFKTMTVTDYILFSKYVHDTLYL